MILNHLVNNLVSRNVNFVLLKDGRCPRLESESEVKSLVVMPPKFSLRRKYYREHRNDFHSVLCFGNIPPSIKLSVPVHTYIHNVSLLKIPRDYPNGKKMLSWLKKLYIKALATNTTDWIVQTTNTENLVNHTLRRKGQAVYQFPFYFIPPRLKAPVDEVRRDYIFVGDYTKAKGHEYLVEAWIKLHYLGVRPTLHLTVSDNHFSNYIAEACVRGVNIINHGKISFDEVIDLYKKSKATVYPSLNESLGLGIIEAAESGCDVIGADLPYLNSVCIPSTVFKPCDSDTIVEAILKYEAGQCQDTELLIHDTIDRFISFLTDTKK